MASTDRIAQTLPKVLQATPDIKISVYPALVRAHRVLRELQALNPPAGLLETAAIAQADLKLMITAMENWEKSIINHI